MKRTLSDWNHFFENKILSLEVKDRSKAGAMLQLIPSRDDWREFLESVKSEWTYWQGDTRYPFCLLILYAGVAFYEYSSGQFWDHFAEAIEREISGGPRLKLNDNFSRVVSDNKLKFFQSDYVGSAVFHIGVPINSWHRFLEICKWALRRDEWKTISDDEWQAEIEKRALTQVRLKNFLLDNREAAADFIQTILDARKLLHEKPDLPFDELPQRNLLRVEYFDEVSETAEFLFPENSKARESLLESRPYLFWYDERARIELHLPGVPRNQLENAFWQIDELRQTVSANSDTLEINGAAFQTELKLSLQTSVRNEKKTLLGLVPFGIYDGRRFINPERRSLPLQSYTIISQQKLEDFSAKDFDKEENRPNELYELKDGTNCFITRLDPIGKTPKFSFSIDGQSFQFKLKRSAKIEAYFFFGEGERAGHFSRTGEAFIKSKNNLPLVCVALPHETDNLGFLQKKFQVGFNRGNSLSVFGGWEKRREDDLREYFVWKWNEQNAVRNKASGVVLTLQNSEEEWKQGLLKIKKALTPPDLSEIREVFLKSETLGFNHSQKLSLIEEKEFSDKCWKNLPSTFLPFFLLCQKDGMTWNEILLAKDVIAPDERDFSETLLRRYARFGFLRQHGQFWRINASEAVIGNPQHRVCQVQFCGNPSLLWTLYQELARRKPALLSEKKIIRVGVPIVYTFPPIEVVTSHKQLPFLQMNWREDLRNDLWSIFDKIGVRVVSDLWRN